MSGLRVAGVTALTLAVSALTLPARADDPPPSPAFGTPLNLRPARPLELAPAPSSSRAGTALTALAAALGAGVWAWKKRRPGVAPARRRPSLEITARRAVGVRSEILVVEIDGQSLLLGVTPGSIQRLAVLPDALVEKVEKDEIEEPEAEADSEILERPRVLPERPRALPERPTPRVLPERPAPARKDARRDAPLEEQVRGLLRARRPK